MADVLAAASRMEHEPLRLAPQRDGVVAFSGAQTARERAWIQCSAAIEPGAALLVTWAVLDALTSERISRLRQPVTSRTRIAVAVVPHARAVTGQGASPLLDGGDLGAEPAALAALRRFAPTLVVHVQDRSGAALAQHLVRDGAGGALEARLIESYLLDPELHAQVERRGALRSRFGRVSVARKALDAAPDAGLGAGAAQYMRRMGFGVAGWRVALDAAADAQRTAVEVGPGRFVPRRAWRRLAGGNVAEIALAGTGAPGLTLQVRGGTETDRAAMALACIEGALVTRLRIDQEAA